MSTPSEVEGPSEPEELTALRSEAAGLRQRLMGAAGGGPTATGGLYVAAAHFIERMVMLVNDEEVEIARLAKLAAPATQEAPSTSPSAPAEPLEGPWRIAIEGNREKHVVLYFGDGRGYLRSPGLWIGMSAAEHFVTTLRAALSVSTSAPKETSEPRGNCTLVIDRERWEIGPGSMSAGDLRERFKLPSYGEVDLWEEGSDGDDRRLMNHHVIQLPAGAVVRLYTGARFINNG